MKLARSVTLFNTFLTGLFLVVMGLHYAIGRHDSDLREVMDIPTFITFWSYMAITPLAAGLVLFLKPVDRRLRTQSLLLLGLWLLVALVVAVLPIL